MIGTESASRGAGGGYPGEARLARNRWNERQLSNVAPARPTLGPLVFFPGLATVRSLYNPIASALTAQELISCQMPVGFKPSFSASRRRTLTGKDFIVRPVG